MKPVLDGALCVSLVQPRSQSFPLGNKVSPVPRPLFTRLIIPEAPLKEGGRRGLKGVDNLIPQGDPGMRNEVGIGLE